MPGGQYLTQKKCFRAAKLRGEFFGLLGGSRGMLLRKIFKIKGPRLTKNVFPEISTWKTR